MLLIKLHIDNVTDEKKGGHSSITLILYPANAQLSRLIILHAAK